MVDEVDFDVIVVGAGIAGCVAAYQLASVGRSVLLVERGEAPGAKNLSGGVLYTHALEEVFPNFVEEAPVERRITRNQVQLLTGGSMVGLDYRDERLADPVNAVTVLRSTFDPWLAERCEEAGAVLMSGVRVDRVLVENGPAGRQVVGVKSGDDELRCHVVVAADGVNSFIAREVGLRAAPATNQLAVGVKSVIGMPAATIEERFGVGPGEGTAWAVVGDCTDGVGGGGFLYTNSDSISIGVVLRLDDLVAQGKEASTLHDRFLAHQYVAPYLRDGELLEYGCHLVAEGGREMVGEIDMAGLVVVGDAAGLTLNTGLTVRGMDLAAASAVAAAAAIDEAVTAGDVSRAGLAGYRRRLFEGFAGKDMDTYAKAPAFLERPRMYREYGELVANVLHDVFRHDLTPRRHLRDVARSAVSASPVRTRALLGDALAGVRAL